MRIYTTCWGSKHLELFTKTIERSFKWPKNNKALLDKNPVWSIYTKEADKTDLIQAVKRIGVDRIEVEIVPDTIDAEGENMGAGLLKCFQKEILRCIETKSKLLLAPPDTLFGDGSLEALFEIGGQGGVCVAVAHPRVLPEILNSPDLTVPLSNAELVSLAWEHLHRSWSEAQFGFKRVNSQVGGVLWRKIYKGLYSVQHRLPTNYLIDFDGSDVEFFGKQICFGAIDHLWPSKLISEQRQRTVGSSDACFICEITDAKSNVPPLYPVYDLEPDKFWRNAPHNQVFRQFNFIFRGSNGIVSE